VAGVPKGAVHKGETAAAVELNKKSRSKDSRPSVSKQSSGS